MSEVGTVADVFAIISGPLYSAIRYAKLLTVTSLLIQDHGCSLFLFLIYTCKCNNVGWLVGNDNVGFVPFFKRS